MEIKSFILEYFEYIKQIRRHLHKNPELSFEENKTQEFLLSKLNELNCDKIERMAKTGIKVVFYGKNATNTIGFRADMDALSLTEENTHNYVSCNKGIMHACGHDGHMSVLLTLAKIISDNKDNIKHNIVLIFQPGEEGTGGAKVMIDEGVLENPKIDKMFGLHLDPSIEEGKIGTKYGYLMASTSEFDINIKGLSVHGATPHLGHDAIVASSNVIMALQTIVSRNIDPFEKCLITIGKMSAGESRNIIANSCKLEGTYRAYNPYVVQKIEDRIKEILLGSEKLYGIKAEYNLIARYPAVNNDENITNELLGVVQKDDVIMLNERMIAEDYSYYQLNIPAVFFFLGTKKQNLDSPLHSTTFDFDEFSLLYGLEIYTRLIGIGGNKSV